ncbi:hypothetical protein BH11MYX4_BH11MYX4_17480 [soil metagenome]
MIRFASIFWRALGLGCLFGGATVACSGGADRSAASEAPTPGAADPAPAAGDDATAGDGAAPTKPDAGPSTSWPAWTPTVIGHDAAPVFGYVVADAFALVKHAGESTTCGGTQDLEVLTIPEGKKHSVFGLGYWTYYLTEKTNQVVYRGIVRTPGVCPPTTLPLRAYSFATSTSTLLGQTTSDRFALAGDRAVFQEGDALRGVRVSDGQSWSVPLDGATVQSIAAPADGATHLVVVGTGSETFSVDPATGARQSLGLGGSTNVSLTLGGCAAGFKAGTSFYVVDAHRHLAEVGSGYRVANNCSRAAWKIGTEATAHVVDLATAAAREVTAPGAGDYSVELSADGTFIHGSRGFVRADGAGQITPVGPSIDDRGPYAADTAHARWLFGSHVPSSTSFDRVWKLHDGAIDVDLGVGLTFVPRVMTAETGAAFAIAWEISGPPGGPSLFALSRNGLLRASKLPQARVISVAPTFGISFTADGTLQRTQLATGMTTPLAQGIEQLQMFGSPAPNLGVVAFRRANGEVVAIRTAPLP